MPDKNPPSSSLLLKDDIKIVSIEDEMKGAYLDYAMSVIVSRALPDVRDGLKPVHRRILFSMNEAGNDYNKPYRKSARIVGDVMGKYHPHGNIAVYETMVRLAQDFNMRIPLVDGQGNFGSVDGDPPAADRYTEARLSRISRELLDDIDFDTVDFVPNYDNSLEEPTVLPAKFPNLLVNGSNGIAVGMATSIPPHNLGEVIDACCALLDNPDLSVEELLQKIPGPDFPTGGILLGQGGILQAYRTGRGSVALRSKTHVEEGKGGRQSLVITEIPYQVNKARMVERIAELVKEKIIVDVSHIRDESDREGMRVVLELKKDAVADVVLNQLYRFSPVQSSVNFNTLALLYGRPEQLSLKSILAAFLSFREEVTRRRTRFGLAKARERIHVSMGFAAALANLDEVIRLIRESPDRPAAKQGLLERRWKAEEMLPLLTLVDDANSPEQGYYLLTAVQADAILDLKLHRLTGLERDSIHEEIKKIAELIQHHLFFLGSAEAIKDSIRKELLDIKERYSTPRRTLIETAATDVVEEDLIQKEDMVVTISLQGYIKRVPLDTYRSQRRGGRGRFGMTTKEEDIVNDVIVANTHDNILFFSTLGQVYSLKTYQLPVGGPQSKGRAMINLFPLSENEKISTILVIPSQEDCQQKTLIFATSFGNIRRNKVSDFARIASNGKKAMRLDEGEFLIGVKMATPDDDIFISTARAMANRFPVSSLRIFSGRESNGVRGIKLDDGDEVINISILDSHNISPEEREAYYKQSLLNKNEPVESSVVRPPEDREKLRFKRAENDRFQQTQNEAHSSETPGPNELDFANPERGRETPNDDSDNSVAFSMEKSRFDELAAQEQFILTVTEKGFGKRTSAYAYRTTNRGTKGVANMLMSSKVGKVVTSFPVSEIDDIILVTDLGRLIRCPVKDIRITRRLAMGVIIVRVNDQESVVAVSRAKSQDSDELQL